jgi:MerR family mercuric resistance operon transcriptional regulator
VKADSVRFYERSHLLLKPARSANGYRVYEQTTVDQLRFIKKAQSLGFSLDEIKRILSLRGQGRTTCRCVVAMAEATLEETERKLEETRRFAASLRRHLQDWRKQAGPCKRMAADFCRLIESS